MKNFRPARILNLCLAALLAVSILFLIRGVLGAGFSGGLVKEAQARRVPEVKKTPQLTEYASLTRENVFGVPSSELTPLGNGKSGEGGEAPANAQVSLIGTVSGELGYAVILRDSKEEVYRRGQTIPGVGKLDSLGRDHAVIVTPGGDKTRLPLKDLLTVKEEEAPQGQAFAKPLPGAQKFARESSKKSSYILDKAALDEAIQNPSGILTHARLLPNFREGRQQGFVVSEVKPNGVFDQLGIKNGDVLLKINQLEISGPDAALRAFSALKGMDRVELDILRAGQKQTYTYEIR
jgi:general secretion pathway protein C